LRFLTSLEKAFLHLKQKYALGNPVILELRSFGAYDAVQHAEAPLNRGSPEW